MSNWSKEPPKEPGFYWFASGIGDDRVECVAELYLNNVGERFWAVPFGKARGYRESSWCADSDTQFGPRIPSPDELAAMERVVKADMLKEVAAELRDSGKRFYRMAADHIENKFGAGEADTRSPDNGSQDADQVVTDAPVPAPSGVCEWEIKTKGGSMTTLWNVLEGITSVAILAILIWHDTNLDLLAALWVMMCYFAIKGQDK